MAQNPLDASVPEIAPTGPAQPAGLSGGEAAGMLGTSALKGLLTSGSFWGALAGLVTGVGQMALASDANTRAMMEQRKAEPLFQEELGAYREDREMSKADRSRQIRRQKMQDDMKRMNTLLENNQNLFAMGRNVKRDVAAQPRPVGGVRRFQPTASALG